MSCMIFNMNGFVLHLFPLWKKQDSEIETLNVVWTYLKDIYEFQMSEQEAILGKSFLNIAGLQLRLWSKELCAWPLNWLL